MPSLADAPNPERGRKLPLVGVYRKPKPGRNVAGIGSQNSAQLRLTQDEEMVHTLAPDRSDQPFGKAIQPR